MKTDDKLLWRVNTKKNYRAEARGNKQGTPPGF